MTYPRAQRVFYQATTEVQDSVDSQILLRDGDGEEYSTSPRARCWNARSMSCPKFRLAGARLDFGGRR